jgi:phage-related minor tail protein
MAAATVESSLTAAGPALVTTIGTVAAVGVTVAVAKWAWPIGIQMFKKLITK